MIDTPYPQYRVSKKLGQRHSACHGAIFEVRHAEDRYHACRERPSTILGEAAVGKGERSERWMMIQRKEGRREIMILAKIPQG